jgi:hypothetical protein
MLVWNDLRLVGRQHGDVIASYLVGRMKASRITPAQAASIINAHIDKHSRGMLATGTSQVDLTVWLDALESAVHRRFPEFGRQE